MKKSCLFIFVFSDFYVVQSLDKHRGLKSTTFREVVISSLNKILETLWWLKPTVGNAPVCANSKKWDNKSVTYEYKILKNQMFS